MTLRCIGCHTAYPDHTPVCPVAHQRVVRLARERRRRLVVDTIRCVLIGLVVGCVWLAGLGVAW